MAEFNYGGQAVIEGVMMRGARHAAVAVRNPQGEIVVHEEALTAPIYTSRWGKMPFIRGLTLLWDALGLGVRALMWSANIALTEEEGGDQQAQFQGPVAWGTVALSMAFGVGIFFLAPVLLTQLVDRVLESGSLLSNITEGVIRLAFFLIYIILIGRLPDIKRVFGYHGAEHKTINAYEAGAELTPESVAQFSLLHPRCGTGFLLVVMIISIIIFGFLGQPPLILRLISRVALIPVIAGLAYEFIRFSAKRYKTNGLIRALITPSLALQRLTTREPDLSMIEVAITALQGVLRAEGRLTTDDEPARVSEVAAA